MKQFTIIEEKWARGGINGVSALENMDGNRCCLGFLCLELGAPTVRDLYMPHEAARKFPELMPALSGLVDADKGSSALAFEIAETNDSPMDDEDRKEELAPLFAKLGWEPIYV